MGFGQPHARALHNDRDRSRITDDDFLRPTETHVSMSCSIGQMVTPQACVQVFVQVWRQQVPIALLIVGAGQLLASASANRALLQRAATLRSVDQAMDFQAAMRPIWMLPIEVMLRPQSFVGARTSLVAQPCIDAPVELDPFLQVLGQTLCRVNPSEVLACPGYCGPHDLFPKTHLVMAR